MQPIRDNARELTAAIVGTAVDYFDFFICATAAALVFGPLFFPVQSAAAQTLLAFVSFGVAFMRGRHLPALERVPSSVLAYAAAQVGVAAPQLATLRAIYRGDLRSACAAQ